MAGFLIWTIGCQMNKADSERLADSLKDMGHTPVVDLQSADIVVLNTCSVRQSAENKAQGKLGELKPLKAKRPDLVIAVMGCMVDKDTSGLKAFYPHVDVFAKPQDFEPILSLVARKRGFGNRDLGPLTKTEPTGVTAFVPIIHGCNNYCSYCIVPYRRGIEKSRPIGEIVGEAQGLIDRGIKEITLLGQNVDSYGHDLPVPPDLSELLTVLDGLEGLARIRFLTSHPKDMSDRLIETIARLDKVCEHINLPLQAGNDDILKSMKRGYSVAQYKSLVSRIRYHLPEVSLSTDIIVGYPGETTVQFEDTLAVLEELKFDTVHVATYSPRQGTRAALLSDDVSLVEKKRRLQAIEKLQEKVAAESNAILLDQTVEILVEGRSKDKWTGRTRTNKLVFFVDDSEHLGQLVQVRIVRASSWSMQAELVKASSVAA